MILVLLKAPSTQMLIITSYCEKAKDEKQGGWGMKRGSRREKQKKEEGQGKDSRGKKRNAKN